MTDAMHPADEGREVGMYLDTTARILVGEYVRSEATGRTYLVTAVRTQMRGARAGHRQHLRCVVVPFDHPEPGDHVRAFVWYRRRHR